MPGSKSKRRKRNKSSPLVENSPKKPKSHKSGAVGDAVISISESDRDSQAGPVSDSDSETTSQSQSQSQSLLKTPQNPEILDPATISLPSTPPSPKMEGQDFIQHSQGQPDPCPSPGYGTQTPIMNPMLGMMAYQQPAMPGLSEHDLIRIAQLVKSMLQQEISEQVQTKVDEATKSLQTELILTKSELEQTKSDLSDLDRVKRIWYLSPMRAAKVQASLRIRAVSPEPSLLAHASSESRGTFRQKARSLAPVNGWACAVTICHDGMLEDTNSLGAAHLRNDHDSLQNEVIALQTKEDEIEQYSRRMCLRISGIRETQNEDVTKKVLGFAKTVNSNIKSADIDRAHRVGRPRSHIDNDETDAFDDVVDESNAKGPEIIIKFTNSSARLNLLQGRSVLRDKKVKKRFYKRGSYSCAETASIRV